MNRETLMIYLLSFLSDFEMVDSLITNLLDIAAGSGYEAALIKLLVKRLGQLSALGVSAVNLEEFESIGNGLFSMHLAGKGFNIRILYSFLPNRQPVLLLAFYERAGKKNTDYTPYIPTAVALLDSKKEAYYHEQG